MTIIQRIANALLDAGEGCLSGRVYVDPRKAAVAALLAMREPTSTMLTALMWPIGDTRPDADTALHGWHAAIDAALTEENP